MFPHGFEVVSLDGEDLLPLLRDSPKYIYPGLSEEIVIQCRNQIDEGYGSAGTLCPAGLHSIAIATSVSGRQKEFICADGHLKEE